MNKHKEARLIYFTPIDLKALSLLSQQRNESKSAVVRKLVHIAKYSETLAQVELNNKLQNEFLKEFSHIGANLNQIAFQLNADITKEAEAKSDFERTMQEFKIMIDKFYTDIKKLKINLNAAHIKTPKKQDKGAENE